MKLPCLFLLVALIATTCRADEPASNLTKPLCLFTGGDCAVRKPEIRRIASAAEWKSAYLDHLGMTAQRAFDERVRVPQIDFDRCVVVAIFQGAGTNSRGLEVSTVAETQDAVTLRYDEWHYQSDGGGDPSAAYGFVVLPKTTKRILVEENVQGLKDAPPKWKLRARLEDEANQDGDAADK